MYFCIMIELAQHIEKLLLDNDCVIVPGLGGFVAHYAPSVRVEEENLFLPPMRTIGFNPQLKMNDGLLVQSYMEVYNTSFSDATRKVEQQVEDLVRHLHEEGKAELPNVGELHCSICGTYGFKPYDDKITTPYLYGLAGFEMKALDSVRTAFGEKQTPDYLLPDKHARSRKIKFEINMKPSYWGRVAAMIAIVLTFFLLSTPIENTEVAQGNYASLFPNDMLREVSLHSVAFTPVMQTNQNNVAKPVTETRKEVVPVKETAVKEGKKASVVAREVKVSAPSPTPKATRTQNATATPAPVVAKKYHIIVASMSTEKEARQMVETLKEKGFKGASAIIGGGKKRVSIESCATYAEAQQTLVEIHKNETYKSAWVLKH